MSITFGTYSRATLNGKALHEPIMNVRHSVNSSPPADRRRESPGLFPTTRRDAAIARPRVPVHSVDATQYPPHYLSATGSRYTSFHGPSLDLTCSSVD